MPRWIKFVALFMLVFAAIDVCNPEVCAQELVPRQSHSQFQVQHDSDGGCQFEEDCFNCGHFSPGAAVAMERVGLVSFIDSEFVVPSLDGTPLVPYHPPRA